MSYPPPEAPAERHTLPEEWCAGCNHSPAYHDRQTGRTCRAWDPDKKDHLCACKGWKTKPPEAAPAQPWGHERKDLQD